MTSTPFPSESPSDSPSSGGGSHPEVTELSALHEGILPLDRATVVKQHLPQCVTCRETSESLAEIRNALGTLPGPPRMPADVAGRIDAALAAEALLDSTTSSAAHDAESAGGSTTPHRTADVAPSAPGRGANSPTVAGVSRETGLAEATEQASSPPRGAVDPPSPKRVSRETRPSDNRPPGHPSGPAHPDGRPTDGPGNAPRRRGGRRRRVLLSTFSVVAVLGLASLATQSLLPSTDSGQASNSPTTTAKSANDRALHARVQGLLDQREKQHPSPESPKFSTKESPDDNVLRETGGTDGAEYVPSCISRPLARPETPLAVDRNVAYGDTTGYLIVLPHPGGGRNVDAYLVDDSCLSEDPPAKGRLVVKRTFPRE